MLDLKKGCLSEISLFLRQFFFYFLPTGPVRNISYSWCNQWFFVSHFYIQILQLLGRAEIVRAISGSELTHAKHFVIGQITNALVT